MAQLKEQKKKNKFRALIIEAQYSPGKLDPNYSHFPPTTFSNTVEVHLGYQTYGDQIWNKIFNYPRLGVSLIYQNLGNNQIFGHQFSVVPTVYFSTAHKEDAKVYAEIRYGLGLACFNKTYNATTDPLNLATGAHAMWQLTLGANLRWNINRYVGMQFGGIWYHASDAHTVLPNVGDNNFAGYVGVVIKPYGTVPRVHIFDSAQVEHQWHFNFRAGIGYNRKGSGTGYTTVGTGTVDNGIYPVYTASVFASKRLAKVIWYKFGVIYRYYDVYHSFLTVNAPGTFTSNLYLKSSAFIAFNGMEFMLGHFAISIEAGVNLYKPAYKPYFDKIESGSKFTFYTKEYIATRFGANYYILDPYNHARNNVYVGAYVSANVSQAEFLEFNVGYVF